MGKWSLEERQEAAAAIADFEGTPGWEIVCSVIEGIRKRKLSELIADTHGREAAEYARALGEIHGLQILGVVTDTIRHKGEAASLELKQRIAGATV